MRESARRAGRYEVALGAVVVAPVAVETIAELKLAVGRTVDGPAFARLADASAATRCTDAALDALARRARSCAELQRWLVQRGHAAAHARAAVDRLEQLGLLDDREFAAAFARTRAGRFGARRIGVELRRRGVASGVVETVLADWREQHAADDTAVAEQAARRLKSLGGLEPAVARRRLLAWLLRRGHDASASSRVVRRLLPGR